MFSRSLLRPLSEALAEYILSADPDHEDEIRSNEIPQICLLLRIILHGQDYLRRSDVGCRVRRLLQDCFSEESSRKKKGRETESGRCCRGSIVQAKATLQVVEQVLRVMANTSLKNFRVSEEYLAELLGPLDPDGCSS